LTDKKREAVRIGQRAAELLATPATPPQGESTSPEELVRMASLRLEGPSAPPAELSSAASQALTYWVGNDDGQAGKRVLEAVRAEIVRWDRGR